MISTENKTNSNRRKFLLSAAKAASLFAVANTSVYVVGSAFKNLDGSMVAGAKLWMQTQGDTGQGLLGCSPFKMCPAPDAGPCSTLGATKTILKCGCDGNGPGSEWMFAKYQCM